MSRNNLSKRGIPNPFECSLCREIDSVKNRFFDYVVASLMWTDVREVFMLILKPSIRWLQNSFATKGFCSSMLFPRLCCGVFATIGTILLLTEKLG